MAKQQLHPGARWLFRFGIFFVSLIFGLWIILPLGGVLAITMGAWSFILLFALFFIFVEVWARLTYNNYAFELRDEGIYVERGVIIKKYSTVPYERIQNVDIHRGILARMLGYSALNVQTAGYAHPRGGRGEGYIPAVAMEKAETMKKQILSRAKKGSGV